MVAEPRVSPGHLLVIDDDASILEAMVDLFQDAGYRVTAAANGALALAMLRDGSPLPDLILLDLMMPVMNGWSFRVEQRRDPALASIPVLAVTADASPMAAAIDVDALLRKPFDPGELLVAVAELVDSAQQRRTEGERLARAERLAAVGQLAQGVAHEINNPLAFLMANLEHVQQVLVPVIAAVSGGQPLPADHLTDLVELPLAIAESLAGARRIQGIVRDIRTFSRMDDRGPRLLEVAPVVEAALQMAHSRWQPRARLETDLAHTALVFIDGDRLQQVLLNLVLNAADAIPEGHPEDHLIRVSSAMVAGRVVIEVSDTGVGMRPNILAHAFEPFFTTKPVGQGTGLGLFVCHRLITEAGGELTVESEPFHGTRFRVQLPAARAPAADEATLTGAAAVPPSSRILVIDDEEAVGRSLKRLLRQHEVSACVSPALALELLGEARFDLILCDLHMPDISGREFWDLMKRSHPEQAPRVAFMSAGILSEQMLEFAQTSSQPVLEKPLLTEDVHQLLVRFSAPQGTAALAAVRPRFG